MTHDKMSGSGLKGPFIENAQRKERDKSMTRCEAKTQKRRKKEKKEGMYMTLVKGNSTNRMWIPPSPSASKVEKRHGHQGKASWKQRYVGMICAR